VDKNCVAAGLGSLGEPLTWAQGNKPPLQAECRGFLESGLVGIWDGIFFAAEAFDVGGEFGPFSAFEGEDQFIDITEPIFAADQSGLDLLGDRKRLKDFGDGRVEKRVGDGEQAHEEEAGFLVAEPSGAREFLAEIGAG